MTRPPTYEEAHARGLLTADEQGIHCFSNGTEYECWADGNCWECAYWPPDGPAGEFCALEAAMFLGNVSPELAALFGFKLEWHKAGDGGEFPVHTHCRFFKQRESDDNGEWTPPPPPPDPNQLVLIADPTEDLARFPTSPALEPVEVCA